MRLAVCVVCLAAAARADDGGGGLTLHAQPRDDQTTRELQPLLSLDPLLESRFETHDADEDTRTARIPIGKHLTALLDTTAWSNKDIAEHGWTSGARITADFGNWHLTALASWNGIDGRVGAGRYRDLGVSVARTFRLSRWMTGWISLSLGVRQWSDIPPAGEGNGPAGMLSFGTTFR